MHITASDLVLLVIFLYVVICISVFLVEIAYLLKICISSHVVGPRHPLMKDPSLDYDVSSDEEWEEVH